MSFRCLLMGAAVAAVKLSKKLICEVYFHILSEYACSLANSPCWAPCSARVIIYGLSAHAHNLKTGIMVVILCIL